MMETILAAPWQMWATLAIISVAIVLYASERLSMELISLGIVVGLILLFELAPVGGDDGAAPLTTTSLLAGFAHPALAAVMCLMVLGQGIFQAGAMERPTKILLEFYSRRKFVTIAGIFGIAFFSSAFVNDTPVVVIFIPIVAALAARGNVSASKLMMPLSFIALFGGMTTVIGSSTNVLAAGVYHSTTGNEIGFFELTPLALVIGATGILYLATVGRYLLPKRELDNGSDRRENKQFIAQFEISRDNSLIGKGPTAGLFPDLPDVTVRMVQRREKVILPPFEDFRFRLGDTVIIAATRNALTNLLKERREILSDLISEIALETDDQTTSRTSLNLVEAIVAPGSRLVGRTVAQVGFHAQTNCIILGIERRSRMIRTQMNTIRLEAGDVLLILGELEDIRNLRADRDLLVFEWSMIGIPDAKHGPRAGIIFMGVVISAAAGLVPIAVAALTGVVAMLLTGCLNIRQAARAFDRRVYLLIGASLAMGLALEETGGAQFLGATIVNLAADLGPEALLSIFFILSAILTNVLSNNATAVLFMPIAVSAAQQAGIDPLPLALTVIYGANCPFATPIAYQTNLLVMTPGHYKFRDFMIVGGPLIILLWVVYSFAASFYFDLN
jgi:di/tricarboxylate transporter